MANKAIRSSLTEQVYQFILKKIRKGEYEAGSRIYIEAIAKEFGTSRTPVREAVSMLVQAGFLENHHLSGPRVCSFDSKATFDLIEVYNILYTALLSKVVNSGNIDELLSELEITYKNHVSAFDQNNVDDAFMYAIKFHEDIIRACPNKKLSQTSLQIQRQLDICVSMYQDANDNLKSSIIEHGQILDSLRKNEYGSFIKLMIEHNKKALNFFR